MMNSPDSPLSMTVQLGKLSAAVDQLMILDWDALDEAQHCAAWNHARELTVHLGNWSTGMSQLLRDKQRGEDERRGGPGEFTAADWKDAVASAEQVSR